MTRALEARLDRLEDDTAEPDDELGELTYDELMILRWYMARDLVADPKTPPGERAAGQRQIEEVEADIVAQAAQVASADYARHLAWCRSMWRSRTGRDDYVPAVTGAMNGYGEYLDWDRSDIMQRRAALHALPAIRRLTGAGAEAHRAPGHPAPLHLYCIFNERCCRRSIEPPGSDDADLARWLTRKCTGGCQQVGEHDAPPKSRRGPHRRVSAHRVAARPAYCSSDRRGSSWCPRRETLR
jgi:hypothetical protein